MTDADFLGQGWRLSTLKRRIAEPPQRGKVRLGTVAGQSVDPLPFDPGRELAAGEESIREAVLIILGTSPGERVMRPDFGCRLQELVFAPNNTATATLAEFYVKEALQKWEPRIEVLGVTADPGAERKVLDIRIDYRINSTNSRSNLVYPFHLERVDA